MYFDKNFLASLEKNTTLSEIIGEEIKLKPHNNGEFIAICPFHKEKTPSFTVNDSKGFYYCFGCGAKGNAITFMQTLKSLSFQEAVTLLCDKYNIAVPDKKNNTHLSSAFSIMQKIGLIFKNRLNKSPSILSYLESRGIDACSMEKFSLGYCDDVQLKKYFNNQTPNLDKSLKELGVIKENGKNYFYNRVIFPIHNYQGNIIGFGGRTLENKTPKYLNSPQTVLFNKRNCLYGEHLARSSIKKDGKVIVVEGYIDVILLHKNGIKNTVSTLGTAVSDEHIERLFKISNTIIFCFDGDFSGRKAFDRVLEKILPYMKLDRGVKFLYLEENKDPSDTINLYGKSHIMQLIEGSKSISNIILENSIKLRNGTSAEDRTYIYNNCITYAEKIKDYETKKIYKSFFREKINNHYWKYRKNTKDTIHNHLIENTQKDESIYGLLKTILIYPKLLTDIEVEDFILNMKSENKNIIRISVYLLDNLDNILNNKNHIEFIYSSEIKNILEESYGNILQEIQSRFNYTENEETSLIKAKKMIKKIKCSELLKESSNDFIKSRKNKNEKHVREKRYKTYEEDIKSIIRDV